MAGDWNEELGSSLLHHVGEFGGRTSLFAQHLVSFLVSHAPTAINSNVAHQPSRRGLSSAGQVVISDLDWFFVSHACSMPVLDVTYFDMQNFSKTDRLAIAVDVDIANSSIKPREKRIIIPRTWKPEGQGMIASVHAYVTDASPAHTPAAQLQQVLRAEAEADYVDQCRRGMVSNEALCDLLALPFDPTYGSKRMCLRYFLTST